MAHDVFISYSHHDKAVADAVCATLEHDHVRCWMAPRDVVPGAEWGMAIVEAINGSRVLVLVFSSKANDSPQISREIERAVNKGVIIVPFRIEEVAPARSLEYFIGAVHWLDALTPPLEKHLANLAETVKILLERPAPAGVSQKSQPLKLNISLKPPARRPAYRRLSLAALALLVAAVGSFWLWRHLHPGLTVPRIAVIGPANNSGNVKYDYLTTQIADVLSTDVAQARKLNPVSREDILDAQEDISLPKDPCSANTHPAPLAEPLGASYLIFGSFHENGSRFRSNLHIALCLLDSNGSLLDTFEQDTDESSGTIFSAQAAERFRHTLAGGTLVPQDFRQVYPQDPDASRLYFEGLSELGTFNAEEALQSLQQAVGKEGSNPLIHWALAQTWSMLRHDQKAAAEANAAVSHLPKGFPLQFDSIIRAGAAEMNKQWQVALPLYASLWNSYPERLDFGLKLASVQTEASMPGAALTTLKTLAALPRPLGQDPRILIEESRALSALANYPGSIAAAEAALQAAKDRRFPVIGANANLQLCRAYQKAGNIDKAKNACEEAEQMFRAGRDDVSAAVALNGLATWLTDRQQYAAARQDYDKVVAIHEAAHNQKDLAGALINRARLATYENKPEEAKPDLRRAIEIAKPIEDKYDQAIAWVILAEISREGGDMDSALTQASQARDLAHSIPDPDVEASALSALALAQTESGKLLPALDACRNLLALRKDPADVATTQTRMGDIYLRLGKFSEARTQYQQAFEGYDRLQRPGDAANALLQLSEVDLNTQQFSAAEKKATRALAVFREQKDNDSEADALAYLLRALAAQGPVRFPEAKTRLKALQSMTISDDEVRLDVALGEGAVLVATGEANHALGLLETAASDARAKGQEFTALQLQLVSVQALSRSGDRAAARTLLSAVRLEARRLGLKLISDRAANLARSLFALFPESPDVCNPAASQHSPCKTAKSV